jgi:TolB-like protein
LRVEHGGLADLAASVADGTPVDWSAVELRGNAADRRLAGHLRLVESIASLHRSIPAHEHEQVVEPEPEKTVGPGPSDAHWGRLSLLERIGEGTSCEVYRAWDTALHRDVALKLLHDEGGHREAHARTLEEARRLARVRHAHVVQVYGAEQHDDRVGLWMELVRGESLEQIVKARGPFGAREAALIGLDLCAALAAVHQAQLLHRDVKAQNVMRESGGRIVLMDFGTGEELSGTNRLVGTPLYLAPEIFSGSKASVQSDLYSLGVLLFHLVTGTYPVMAASMEQLGRAHANRERHPLRDLRPDLPQAFVRTIERAIEPDRSRRFRSAGEMEAALQASLEPVPQSEPVAASSAPDKPGRRARFAFAAVAAALVLLVAGLIVWTRGSRAGAGAGTISTIAVMPLSELAGSAAPPLFVEGLTDQLVSTLGQIRALRVKSWSSVAAVRDRSASPAEIAAALGADALVETTVLVAGASGGAPARVRVNARLIAAASETQLWSKTFERPMGEMFALQASIARDIADALHVALTPFEAGRLRQQRPTTAAAEEAFFQGRVQIEQYGSEPSRRALEAFQRAVQLDSNHAGAHAGMSRAYFTLGFRGAFSQPEARALAEAAARKAIELDDTLPDAHATIADLRFYYDWDWQAAEASYKRSIETNSTFTYGRTQYAQMLAAARRLDEAVEQAATAVDLNPLSADARRIHGLILYYKRDFPAAGAAIRRSFDIEPNAPGGWVILGRIAEAEGRSNDALKFTQKAIELSDGAPPALRVQLIRLRALQGKTEEARQALSALDQEFGARNLEMPTLFVAHAHLALGDEDAAIDYLERAARQRSPTLLWLAVDPRMDAISADPRFRKLVAQLGIR